MQVPVPFELALVAESHGWSDLPPWRWDPARAVLGRPLRLASGRVVHAEVAPAAPGRLAFRAAAAGRLSGAEAAEARRAMAAALALDEDLAPFHARAAALEAERASGRAGLPDLRWAIARGAGRLLRSPTVFEDAVKTLLTTNCSWSLTRAMVTRLCDALGEPGPLGGRTFPGPAAMAAAPARFYRETVRAGYRAPFLAALARAVASGALDLEALRASPLPTETLAARISALAGFGPYATEHLLRLLGRHEHLALDAWTRGRLGPLLGRRRPPSDRALRRAFAPYGPWAGLAMWLTVTADWHGEAAPA